MNHGSSFLNIFLSTGLCGALLLLAPAVHAEEKDKKEEPKKVTYDDDVRPILRQRCGSCHNANEQKGGLAVDTFAGLMEGGGSGEVVDPGDAGSSYLYLVITHDSEPVMPPNQPKMPDQELALIREWIDLGALENKGSKVVKKKSELAKIEISTERPADAPVMPEGMGLSPVHVTSSPNSVTALAASPWAPLAAVSGFEQVLLFETETGSLAGVLPFPEGTPHILKFSRNGQLLLAGGGRGGASGNVVVWNVKTGERVAELGDEYDSVLAADISSDHSLVVLAGPKRMVRVYSVQSGEMLYELKKHTDWVLAAEFSPDGVLLATADRSNGMFLWEALTGNEYLSMKGHTGAITDVSWRPDSNLVASSSEDGTIRLWELNNGNEVKRWNAHGGGVSSLDYTREANLVSIGRDKAVKLWNGEGNNLKTYGVLSDLGLEVAYDAELKRVLGGDWAGEVRVWDADSTNHLYSIHPNPPGLEEQLSQANQKFAQVEEEAKKVEGQITALNQQLAARKQAFEQAQEKQAELEANLKQANTDKGTADKQLADARTQAETLKKAADQAQQAVTAAQQGLKTADSELAAKKQEQQQVAQATQEAQNGLTALQNKIAELEKQGDEAAEELAKTRKELEAAEQQLSEKTAQLDKLKAATGELDKKQAQAKQQADEATVKLEQARKTHEQHLASIKNLEAQVNKTTEAIKTLTQQTEAQKKAVADMQPKVAATEEEQKKLTEWAAAKQQAGSRKDRLQAYVKELQKQIAGTTQAAAN